MYQFNMSIDKKLSHWFSSIEKVFSMRLKALDGVVATKEHAKRIEISVACESNRKSDAVKIIRKTLLEMYLTVVKYDYLEDMISLPNVCENSYKILLHTLVAFDREAESEIIENQLKLGDYLSLDGFFNFRLRELRTRWDEIAQLASSNAVYLGNDETLNELLKFLMSAVTPKIQKLSITVLPNIYNIKGEYNKSNFEIKINSAEKLMIYLINIAPLELILEGEFLDKQLYKRIISIFDGKSASG